MPEKYLKSKDNINIAYDITGSGPALVLLHGGGKTRKDWQKLDYIERFQKNFTVITIDIRGSGESDFLIEESDYEIDKICDDVIAVVDECKINNFSICGYSFGGAIAKYLAANTERVTAMVMIGVSLFGPTVSPKFEEYIEDFVKKWNPLLEKYKSGELSATNHKTAIKGRIVIWIPCFLAMKKWPNIEPEDINCPVMLLTGSKNKAGMNWIETNRQKLDDAKINIEIIEGLDHQQEFGNIKKVFPVLLEFLEKHAR
jgi:pimeloyl-ACP methyl ester carboxylesterase